MPHSNSCMLSHVISTSVPLKRFMRGICATVSAIAVDLNSNPSLIGVVTSYKAFDEAFDKAMASLGKERDEAWEEANKALMDDMPITALYYPSFVALINEDQVENVELTLGNSFMFSHAEIVE